MIPLPACATRNCAVRKAFTGSSLRTHRERMSLIHLLISFLCTCATRNQGWKGFACTTFEGIPFKILCGISFPELETFSARENSARSASLIHLWFHFFTRHLKQRIAKSETVPYFDALFMRCFHALLSKVAHQNSAFDALLFVNPQK